MVSARVHLGARGVELDEHAHLVWVDSGPQVLRGGERKEERERERRQSRGIKAKVAAEIAVTVHVRGVVVVTSFRFVGLGAEYDDDDDGIEKYGERLSKPQLAMPLS